MLYNKYYNIFTAKSQVKNRQNDNLRLITKCKFSDNIAEIFKFVDKPHFYVDLSKKWSGGNAPEGQHWAIKSYKSIKIILKKALSTV